ncbi:MAG: hypothetical protein IPO48_07020 [Saprospiraceae bacterium]|nr:hypothetical protein [Saprospiraceae bacterium]
MTFSLLRADHMVEQAAKIVLRLYQSSMNPRLGQKILLLLSFEKIACSEISDSKLNLIFHQAMKQNIPYMISMNQ